MPPSSNIKALKKRHSNKRLRSPRPFDIEKSLAGTPRAKLRKRARHRIYLRKEVSPSLNAYSMMSPFHSTTPLTNSPRHSDRDDTATTPPSQKGAVRETLETTDFFTHETFLVSTLKKMAFRIADGLQVIPLTIAPPNSPAEGLLH